MRQRWQLPLIFAVVVAGTLAFAYLTKSLGFLPGLLAGAWITVQITAAAAVLAVIAAVAAGIAKLYGALPLRWFAVAYIEIFRGTSALVQLFWLFFVLPYFGISLEPMTAAILGLGLNIGAYGAEVVRGAIQAVPRGQWEAATALNMSWVGAMRRIVLPQAFIAMIPPWGNLLIELLKSTALVSMITIGDLAFRAQQMNQTTIRTIPVFTQCLLVYLCLSLVITYAMRLVESWAAAGQARGPRPAAGGAVAGGGQHSGHRVAVHPSRPRLGPQLTGHRVGRASGPVRPWLGPCMVEVGGGEHPSLGTYGTTGQAARIARSVEALVMLDGNGGQRGERG